MIPGMNSGDWIDLLSGILKFGNREDDHEEETCSFFDSWGDRVAAVRHKRN